jgi:hypothetical protein
MDDDMIIAVYVIIDDLLAGLDHHSHPLAQTTDSEILAQAVLSALYFANHHERSIQVLYRMGYFVHHISTSRFCRRLHQLAAWLELALLTLGQLFATGDAYIIDSFPLPVCRRVRANRCRKVGGRAFCGYCAAKDEKFFGWRLHLVATRAGVPVAFNMLPGSWHDLNAVNELLYGLPAGAAVFGDKGYISADVAALLLADTGVRLVAQHRANMAPNSFADWCDLKWYRHSIETLNSQLEKLGVQRLHARTNEGFAIKVLASLFAITCLNMI